jgi:hypothetical protein
VFLVFAVGHPGTDSRGTGFELDGDVLRWDRPGVSLVVRQLDGDATGRLADAAGGDLLALSDALGVDAPRVHVDRGLGVFERASLPWTGPSVTDAVLVRAGFDSPHFQLRTFRVWLLGQVFEPMTRGRLRRGGWRVIQDGYPGWSVARSVENSPAQSRQEELRVAWGLQALAASGISDDALLARWPDVRRRVGDVVAQSLAQHVLSLVGKEQGDAAVRALARGALDERRAFFGSFRANEDSLESLFVQHAGASRADVSRRLAALRDPLLAKHAEALATLAPLDSLVVAPGPEDPNGLRALRFSTGAGPGRFAFLHAGARLSLILVQAFSHTHELPCVITRSSNNYGLW